MLRPIALLALVASLAAPRVCGAQVGTSFNQRDDQYRLLGLKRAKAAYELSRAELERKQGMFDNSLVSLQELERARNALADAEVNYQQSLLAVLFERQYVTVQNAVKRRGDDGRSRVTVTLANASGGGEEYRQLLDMEDELFRSLQPDVVHDVYVSLLNDENVIISRPYEVKIEELRHGDPVDVEFGMLQELDAVTVDLVYGNGTQRSPRILLEKDASVNKVVVQAAQFSQEVELDGEATFELTLELFSGTTDTFRLVVVNLPPAINAYFVDPVSQARLRQFKFTDRTDTRRAALRVFLPDRAAEGVVIDEPIRFEALVVPADGSVAIDAERPLSRADLEALDVGMVPLELVPRGVGELLVRAPQLFHSIRAGEQVDLSIDVVNEGTRRLDNVELEVDAPLRWKESVEPSVIPVLGVGEERTVSLTFVPPSDVAVGRYEFRIRTTSVADNQPVSGEEKNVTVEVEPTANVLATLLLVSVIVGLITGIVAFGIRLSRR